MRTLKLREAYLSVVSAKPTKARLLLLAWVEASYSCCFNATFSENHFKATGKLRVLCAVSRKKWQGGLAISRNDPGLLYRCRPSITSCSSNVRRPWSWLFLCSSKCVTTFRAIVALVRCATVGKAAIVSFSGSSVTSCRGAESRLECSSSTSKASGGCSQVTQTVCSLIMPALLRAMSANEGPRRWM
jgi:hypothetical protein